MAEESNISIDAVAEKLRALEEEGKTAFLVLIDDAAAGVIAVAEPQRGLPFAHMSTEPGRQC